MASELLELASKLSEYEEQLLKVGKLLQLNPSDSELFKMYTDLSQLVEITRTLQASAPVEAAAEAPPSASSAEPAASAELPFPAALLAEGRKKKQETSRVMAQWNDGVWYVAKILRELPAEAEGQGPTLEVLYLEYGNTFTVAPEQIKPYVSAPRDLLQPGVSVRAVHPQDGLMYPARVVGPGAERDHFRIQFKANKAHAEVPAYDILIDEAAQLREKRAEEERAKLLSADVLEIPEYLKPKESDSKALKESKKLKVRAIKSEHKKRKLEEIGEQKQQNWQNFRSGIEKKKSKRVKTSSIFATTQEGKVGVTGSGRGLTSFEPRKKQYVSEDQANIANPDE